MKRTWQVPKRKAGPLSAKIECPPIRLHKEACDGFYTIREHSTVLPRKGCEAKVAYHG